MCLPITVADCTVVLVASDMSCNTSLTKSDLVTDCIFFDSDLFQTSLEVPSKILLKSVSGWASHTEQTT